MHFVRCKPDQLAAKYRESTREFKAVFAANPSKSDVSVALEACRSDSSVPWIIYIYNEQVFHGRELDTFYENYTNCFVDYQGPSRSEALLMDLKQLFQEQNVGKRIFCHVEQQTPRLCIYLFCSLKDIIAQSGIEQAGLL